MSSISSSTAQAVITSAALVNQTSIISYTESISSSTKTASRLATTFSRMLSKGKASPSIRSIKKILYKNSTIVEEGEGAVQDSGPILSLETVHLESVAMVREGKSSIAQAIQMATIILPDESPNPQPAKTSSHIRSPNTAVEEDYPDLPVSRSAFVTGQRKGPKVSPNYGDLGAGQNQGVVDRRLVSM